MDLAKEFTKHFPEGIASDHDFNLFEVSDGFFLGYDESNNVAVVCRSNKPNRAVLMQKTKLLSVECNVNVSFFVEDTHHDGVVHIIRCFAQTKREREIFIELSPLFHEACCHEDQEEAILEVVATLSSFFASSKEPSFSELQGLYAELYTILSYSPHTNLGRFWQSKDRMKFDFSISDRTKLEIKSTIKPDRIHHFRHEQLLSDIYYVYVISYMLREDDEGLSLYDIIEQCKPLLQGEPKKLLTIYRITKNASIEQLKAFRFNEEYARKYRRIYRAIDIPQFAGSTPVGVTNAEYDCNLTCAVPIKEDVFWKELGIAK